MRLTWLFIMGGVMVWPIGWRAASAGGKPIDLLPSDFLPLLVPLTYVLARTRAPKSQQLGSKHRSKSYMLAPVIALIFVAYSMSLAGIGVGMSGEAVRLFSAFKLVKPISFIFFGFLLGAWTNAFEFIRITGIAYGALVALTLFCTVADPDFPIGEWGKYIFEFEIAGYPNSAMSFYAALVPLLLAVADCSTQHASKVMSWGLAACSALIILGSMSRSSALAMFCGVSIYLVMTGRTSLLIAVCIGLGILSLIGFGLFSILRETQVVTVLMTRVQMRLERSIESEDPSSGRFGIWQLALELWMERPIFGYMFESFSRYAEEDTPHQQYLEVLHKCGGLGLLIYLSLLASCLSATTRLIRVVSSRSSEFHLLQAIRGMLFGILIGNLTQPNLTYSLTGNLVFLLIGILCSSRTMLTALQTKVTEIKAPRRKPPSPLRVAA